MARPIAVCDAETDPFRAHRVPKPFVWGYFDGKEYRYWWQDQRGFIDFLKEQHVICYAHNGGKFDWHFVLDDANPYDDLMIINGRIAKLNIGACECRDSYNIIPVPLAPYKKDEIDYGIMEAEHRNKPRNKKKILEYLRSDVMYLYELVSRFRADYGVQLTQASAAMAQWKKVSKRPLPRTDQNFYDAIAPYYYGGRVQCFEQGVIDTDFSIYDINSAYPYAMLHEHPYSGEYDHVDGFVDGADFYTLEARSLGAFPYRGDGDVDRNAGLHFPDDNKKRVFTVTKWEYEAAREAGYCNDKQVTESILFAEHVDFRDYINHFYELRLKCKAEKDEAGSLFAKLLMNSLYGKFASNPDNYRNYMIVPMDVIGGLAASGWEFGGELGPWGLAEAPLNDEQKRYYNIATSASITGFVRAYLLKAIHSSEGVLYCDTDSMAVRKVGESVSLGDALGQWKHEGDFDRAGIAGKKLYIFRGVPDSKGKRTYKTASKGARLTNQQLWQVARGAEVIYVPDAPTFSPRKEAVFTQRRIKFTA